MGFLMEEGDVSSDSEGDDLATAFDRIKDLQAELNVDSTREIKIYTYGRNTKNY